tara:strand:+ start:268 stop:1005 length:738 start_codon:yes stop_codon:yes gene_type:complete
MNKSEVIKVLGIPPELQHLINVRQSNRAKRLIFKASTLTGVEIVLPREFSKDWVVANLNDRGQILMGQLKEISQERLLLKPDLIDLTAIGKAWKVIYSDQQCAQILETQNGTLTLSTRDHKNDPMHIPGVLQDWLKAKAVTELPEMLHSMASKIALNFNNVRIKNQKTIWGSCSAKKNINLNQKLLFLPPEVVSYVLKHELVHLKVFDHSEKFWTELGKYIENPKQFRSILLKESEKSVPLWATL